MRRSNGILFALLIAGFIRLAFAQESLWERLSEQVGTLYQQGQYAEAVPIAKKALQVAEKTFGSKDPHVALSLNNLAILYKAQEKYADAEPLYRLALSIDRETLGADDPQVVIDLTNLGKLYRAEQKYIEAESLFKEALADFEKALGPDDLGVAMALTNVADIESVQGKFSDAEPLLKRALSLYEKHGKETPEYADSLNVLAGIYRVEKKYSDSELLYKHALQIMENSLGPEHPSLAPLLDNMANLYFDMEKLDQAAKLSARAAQIRKQGKD